MNIRWQIDVPEERDREIEALMKECDISTKKEFFNNAVTLLKWAVAEKRKGRIIATVEEEGKKYRELQMPILSAITVPGPSSREETKTLVHG